ncbi:MAG: BMP family protein [Candidatus Eremiobacterota bacterium]
MKHLLEFFLIILLITAISLSSTGCKKVTDETSSGKLKIALILPSGKDDLSWSESMYDGLMEVQKEENIEVSVTEKQPNPVDAGTALRDYANRNFNIIIAHGSQYQSPLFDVADEFPDITFAYGIAFDTARNIFSYDTQSQNGGYLFGTIAAKLTKSKVVGIVGPVKAGDAIKYNYGFRQGIESVDKKINVLETYTGAFGDTVKAKEMAIAHMDARADILTGTSQQAVGAIQAVSEKKGVYWFSDDMNQTSISPDHIIASQVYQWKEVIKYIIENHRKGKHGGEKISLDFANQRLAIVFNPALDSLITPEIKKIFNENLEKIKKGEIKVKLPGKEVSGEK